jgi:hypothetical protein
MNWTRHKNLVYVIPLSVFAVKILDFLLQKNDIYIASSTAGSEFLSNFIEWFGVIYGLLLPLIMVRVWEQLDSIDREFDREADAVKALYEDIFFLEGKCATIGSDIAELLRIYVDHVNHAYHHEVKPSGTLRDLPESQLVPPYWEQAKRKTPSLVDRIKKYLGAPPNSQGTAIIPDNQIAVSTNTETELRDPKEKGDELLENIRCKFRSFFLSKVITTKASEILVEEMFHRLNEIIDIRGDRIGLASQRLFETLRTVALLTSIIFLLPFYFVGFTATTQLLDEILIGGVTLLVIFIYLIIEDLDEPFGGIWNIDTTAWERLLIEMNSDERKIELENLIKINPSTSSSGKGGTQNQVVSKRTKGADRKRKTSVKQRSKPTQQNS